MRILHSESSLGWGGQEIRILNEIGGMRNRGHEILLVVGVGSKLTAPARQQGFDVIELPLKRAGIIKSLFFLFNILKDKKIDIINTHSSFDAWLLGILGRFLNIPVVRTRHLSTPIRKGINSLILYNFLARATVTTCEEVVAKIRAQAMLGQHRCISIPTGVEPSRHEVDNGSVADFRAHVGCKSGDVLVGTLCILRGWKGVADLLEAAKLLQDQSHLRWVVIGEGPSDYYFYNLCQKLGLQERVIFTGYLPNPTIALAALDIFVLLSYAHEGVSQASLQAAWLSKPLVTTATGGLKEICLDGITGIRVPPQNPQEVAEAVKRLLQDEGLRQKFGIAAKKRVMERFMQERMLDDMERVYQSVLKNSAH